MLKYEILNHLNEIELNAPFSWREFSQLSNDVESIRVVLNELYVLQIINMAIPEIYYLPKFHNILGELTPSVESVVSTYAASKYTEIFYGGAHSANLVGISLQVPAQYFFITTGEPEILNVFGMTVTLEEEPMEIPFLVSPGFRSVLYGLLWIGEYGVEDWMFDKIYPLMTEHDMKYFDLITKNIPNWLRLKFQSCIPCVFVL